jgi:hypothetical protein
MANYTGGCLCGAIRYSVNAPITDLRACHCRDCQKASGAHGAVVAIVASDKFKLEKGTPKRYTGKAASGRTLYRFFCADCGSPIYGQRETTPEMMTLRAGTLDESNDLKVAMHIWTGSKRSWSHIDPQAKQHPGQP